jgi:hypothetical protein
MRSSRNLEGAELRDLVERLARRIAALAYRQAHRGSTEAEAQAHALAHWGRYVERAVDALAVLETLAEGEGSPAQDEPTRGIPKSAATHAGPTTRPRRPPLTLEQILSWADAHFARTGAWPTVGTGPVSEAPGQSWRSLDYALRYGRRGLPGGDSLPRLLDRCRGARPGSWRRWTEAEDGLLGALPAAEVAARTGRTLVAVWARRRRLGLSDGRRSG